MSTNQEESTIAKKGVIELGETNLYSKEVENAIRSLLYGQDKNLQEQGILVGGKYQGGPIHDAVLGKIEELVGKHYGDKADYNWRDNAREGVTTATTLYKDKDTLIAQITGAYEGIARNHARERNSGRMRNASLPQSKDNTKAEAKLAGIYDLDGDIDAAKDITDVLRIKGNYIQPRLEQRVRDTQDRKGDYKSLLAA